jgi:hypothetical protein
MKLRTSNQLIPLSQIGDKKHDVLVNKFFYGGQVTVVYGAEGEGKTLTATALSTIISSSFEYDPQNIASERLCVYLGNEGMNSLGIRQEASEQYLGLSNESQLVMAYILNDDVFDLSSIEDLKFFLEETLEKIARKPGFLIIDTFSSVFEGRDENSAQVVSSILSALNQLAAHTGMGVILIHHSSGENKPPRGSSLFRCNVASVIKASMSSKNKHQVILEVEKMKDGKKGLKMTVDFKPYASQYKDSLNNCISTLVPHCIELPGYDYPLYLGEKQRSSVNVPAQLSLQF